MLGLEPGVRAPLPAFFDPFSYIDVDMMPVVAMLMGRGLRGWAEFRRRTPEVGVAGPASLLIALGERCATLRPVSRKAEKGARC
jgi:hypothetical protein